MSHQDCTAQFSAAEVWAFRGNQAADDLAACEFSNHPCLMEVRDNLIKEIKHLDEIRLWVHHVLVRVGKLALPHNKRVGSADETAEDPRRDLRLEPIDMPSWSFPRELPQTAAHYNVADWLFLAEWISSLHASHGTMQFWSWLQLSADLHQVFPDKGPWYCQKDLQWESKDTMPQVFFVRHTRWLTTFLMNLAKALDQPLPIRYRSPDSHTIWYWLNTLPVRVSHERLEMAETWL